jgi:hypothetical protein
MCKLSGNRATVRTTTSDFNGKVFLKTHYTVNAKCVPDKRIKLLDNRPFECRPIQHDVKESIRGSGWITKKITVDCEVVISQWPMATSMCKLSGNAAKIKTKKSDENVKLYLLTHYTDNAKCVHNGKIKLKGNQVFDCRPIEQEMFVKSPVSLWTYKKITVGCKVVILL